jgi:hypothetical protein
MPDMSPLLIRICVGATGPGAESCSQCRRTPLAGEHLHRLESNSVLCELCFSALPDDRRLAVRSDRVRAGERALAVAPMAA